MFQGHFDIDMSPQTISRCTLYLVQYTHLRTEFEHILGTVSKCDNWYQLLHRVSRGLLASGLSYFYSGTHNRSGTPSSASTHRCSSQAWQSSPSNFYRHSAFSDKFSIKCSKTSSYLPTSNVPQVKIIVRVFFYASEASCAYSRRSKKWKVIFVLGYEIADFIRSKTLFKFFKSLGKIIGFFPLFYTT